MRKPSGQIGDRLMRLLITFTLLMICLTAMGQTFDTESTGKGIIIQNSFPKGGQIYTDPTGKDFVYAIFWTRVINETASPVELTIKFPAESFAVPSSPDNYFKLFLPPDTMTIDKEPLFDYGITDLKSFLDTSLNKPTMLQKSINPKEAFLFYVATLFSHGVDAVVRAALVLREQDLFYKITGKEIPSGQIVLKKNDKQTEYLKDYVKLRKEGVP